MHNVTEIKMSPPHKTHAWPEDRSRAARQLLHRRDEATERSTRRWFSLHLARHSCLLVISHQAGAKQRLPYGTPGCVPMIKGLGPSLAICWGCASAPSGGEASLRTCPAALPQAAPGLLQLRGQKPRCSGFFLTHCTLKLFQS